ncbi:EAL domain-containing protein (plasmid) [Deinococcus taeanensis]|uniref:putative bifunctional diguanylate cyclase/phosphodiesterase n=1 Tax=Deinococcus taeanensis TaxID=2737050 RepID=UPI001CDC93E6|nr:EAL domain-containing protein [Deinococcus taeanensis]UBV44534.1 EAL domain-containing protein [Deinococcus taeanensis]
MTEPHAAARERQTLQRAQALYDMARTLTDGPSEEELLRRVVNSVVAVLGVNRAVLLTLSEDVPRVEHFLVAGPGAVHVQRPTWQELATGLTGWVLRERRVARSPAGQDDPREGPEARQRRRETVCGDIIVLPIMMKTRVFGTLTLINLPWGPPFTDDDVAWLEALVHQAAAAVQQERLIQTLHRHALFDARTGLPARPLANDRLRQSLWHAQRSATSFALLLLQPEPPSDAQSASSAEFRDALAVQIARRLQDLPGAFSTLAHWDDETFMLIAEDVPDEHHAFRVVNQVMNAFAEPFVLPDLPAPLPVTASVGVSIFPVDGQDVVALHKHAAVAQYNARHAGGGSAARFSPTVTDQQRLAQQIAAALPGALERNELFLMYQPQLDAQRRLWGFEALLRWQHKTLGLVPPDVFIPVAERTGLILPLGEWVMRQACRQLRAWQDRGALNLHMAVNVSQVQLQHPEFVHQVEAALRAAGLNGEQLELELTEQMVFQCSEVVRAKLAALHHLNVRLALDDFGVGHSSMQTLAQLPFDVLKLDQSFVRDLEGNARTHRIVKAIVDMAHDMKMTVVAEGVEGAIQWQLTEALECDRTQGYLLSRPLAAEAVPAWMNLHASDGRGLPRPER